MRGDDSLAAEMQRFLASDAKYSYSPDHAVDRHGASRASASRSSRSRASPTTSRRRPTSRPSATREAEKLKWAVTGPIAVAGAKAGGAVAVTIHAVEVTTPGVVVYGAYTAEEPLRVVGRRERLRASTRRRAASLRFDERTTLPTRPLIGCLAVAPGRGRAAREAPGPLRRQPRLPRDPRRRDARPARRARRRRALLRRLQGAHGRRRDRRPARGRRARDRERRAARAAGVDDLAAHRDGRQPDDARLRQAARVERAPGLPRAARVGRRGLRRSPARRRRCCSRWSRTPASARSATPTTRPTASRRATCSSRTAR